MKYLFAISLFLATFLWSCKETISKPDSTPKIERLEEYIEHKETRLVTPDFNKTLLTTTTDSVLQVRYNWLGTTIPFGLLEFSFDRDSFLCTWQWEEGPIVPDVGGFCSWREGEPVTIGITAVHEPTNSTYRPYDKIHKKCEIIKHNGEWYIEFEDLTVTFKNNGDLYNQTISGRILWSE